MKKPYVICHMMSTVDGKILTANWGAAITKTYGGVFEKYHQMFESQAWMCGRVTMEKDFSGGVQPELVTPPNAINRNAYIGNKAATSFAIAIDPKGKLGWESNETGGDHIIEVLTEEVSDAYLYYLQRKHISYIIAGKSEVDFAVLFDQLSTLFPIETLMLEGGGHINGSVLNAGLIDEISLLLIPVVDGTAHTPTTFEVSDFLSKKEATLLQLDQVTQVENGVLWLRYIIGEAEGA